MARCAERAESILAQQHELCDPAPLPHTPSKRIPELTAGLSIYREPAGLQEFRNDWERLSGETVFSSPNFDELLWLVGCKPEDFMLVAYRLDGRIVTLACFYRVASRKSYRAGERRIFSLPVCEVMLFGASMLGRVDTQTTVAVLAAVSAQFRFDVLTFGEIRVEAPLFTQVCQLPRRYVVAETSRKRSVRWLIRLPPDFDGYMMTLGAKSRQNIRREIRQLDKQFECEFLTVTSEAGVEPFLASAESISRKTYQWNVGQRMLNNDLSRRSLTQRAQRGELRCYSLALGGQPCAFMRGSLVGGIFAFETAGFDPQFNKASPGAVLLMWAVRDLIENSDCKIFDFGSGGDNVGYKARFGNESHACASLELGLRTRPYTLLLFGLQRALLGLLNLANRLIGDGAFRARVKHALRKYGDR